jgi:hypothetical protein
VADLEMRSCAAFKNEAPSASAVLYVLDVAMFGERLSRIGS